ALWSGGWGGVREGGGAYPPLGVRIAPPSADAGARCVDQHQIGSAGKVAQHLGVAAWCAHLDIAHAGPFDPGINRRQAANVRVGCARSEERRVGKEGRTRELPYSVKRDV